MHNYLPFLVKGKEFVQEDWQIRHILPKTACFPIEFPLNATEGRSSGISP